MALSSGDKVNSNQIQIVYSEADLEKFKQRLYKQGFVILNTKISQEISSFCYEKKWQSLDDTIKEEVLKGSDLFKTLNYFHPISSIEFIISLRESINDWEEDGIWHDDGSRVIAFSLSLTHPEEIKEGGVLKVRKKNSEQAIDIPTPGFGEMIIFLTGIHGYEHKIHQVKDGKRLIIAGWGS